MSSKTISRGWCLLREWGLVHTHSTGDWDWVPPIGWMWSSACGVIGFSTQTIPERESITRNCQMVSRPLLSQSLQVKCSPHPKGIYLLHTPEIIRGALIFHRHTTAFRLEKPYRLKAFA